MIKFLIKISVFYLFSIPNNYLFGQEPDLPNPKFQLKYFLDPYEHPSRGIRLYDTTSPLSKFLSENYVDPTSHSTILNVWEQWGFDTIRTVSKKFAVNPFFILNHEVTNLEYRNFITDTSTDFFKIHNLTKTYVYPDTTVWEQGNEDDQQPTYVHYYFQHKAYNNFPVVGISLYQAKQYCKWKEFILNSKYKKFIPKGYKLIVDLPTNAEFMLAEIEQCYADTIVLKNLPAKNGVHQFDLLQSEDDEIICFNYLKQHPEINFKTQRTERLLNLKKFKPKRYNILESHSGAGPIHNIFGNVSEWTSSKAMGSLYNDVEWYITLKKNIVMNLDIPYTNDDLKGYLYGEKQLKTFFMTKGGSWTDDFFYLDPCSAKFKRGDFKSKDIGFRTVIRIVPVAWD